MCQKLINFHSNRPENDSIDLARSDCATPQVNLEEYKAYKNFMENVQGLIDCTNEALLYENANKDGTLASTQRDLLAGEVSKLYINLNKNVIPQHVRDAIKTNALKFHDQDYFIQKTNNCSYINLTDMLDNGTVINKRMIDSPTSFPVACTVTTQIMAAVSSSQYGGTTVSAKPLAKYLRRSYDRAMRRYHSEEVAKAMMMNDLEQGVQAIHYQLNTLSTSNGQSPYCTLFLHMEENYEYEFELHLIIQEILRQRIIGIKDETGHFTTFAFPKLVYVLDENNVKPDSKYYELTRLAAECTAKRMVPDYISAKVMKETYDGNVFPPMGCRSFLCPWKDSNGEYKFEGRCNLGVVTLNLPQLAILAKGDFDKFWELFYDRMSTLKDALLCRVRRFSSATSDVAPIIFQHGAIARLPPGAPIGDIMKGGFGTLSVGYIGVYEMVKLMTGKQHSSGDGLDFGLKVLEEMHRLCDVWRLEEDYAFTLYGTPSESTAGALCEKDQKTFGTIENITDKGWYTNSFHIDVREQITCFDKLSVEAKYQKYSTGGTISYIEIPNMTNNIDGMMEIMDYMYENIMYSEMNTKSDYCRSCRTELTIVLDDDCKWYCPKCGERRESQLNVVRRTCGYIGENFWNKGKTKEIKLRTEHVGIPIERGIQDLDPVNGNGLRVSAWFQGCPHACPGCHNQHLWKQDNEFRLNIDRIVELCTQRKKLSILGGEPLAPYNRQECLEMIRRVRAAVPDCSIYVWSGYEIAELEQSKDKVVKEIVKSVSKLVVGRFINDLKVHHPWYGSSNQQILKEEELGELLNW